MTIPFLVAMYDGGVPAPPGTNRPTGYIGSALDPTFAYDNPMAPPDTTTFAHLEATANATQSIKYTGMPISGGSGTLNVAATMSTETISVMFDILVTATSSASISYSKDNGATWLTLWSGSGGTSTDHLTPLTAAITGATAPTILVSISVHGQHRAHGIGQIVDATASGDVYDIWMT